MNPEILRVGFSPRKVPDDVDHIIIGSGLSGLYLGALLSKAGRKVLVLEQHYVAGGCTHTFKDKGFEFDTGVHYLGQATILEALMDFAAGRLGALQMLQLGAKEGTDVYNEIVIGDRTFHVRPGKETFIRDLLLHFPDEEKGIRSFFREVFGAVMTLTLLGGKQFMPPWAWHALTKLPGPARWMIARHVHRTTNEVLAACQIRDPTLRALLTCEFGDYGILPDEGAFCMQAVILFHYIWEGGYYPEGGSDAFAEALVPGITQAGGAVLVRAPVSRILVEGNVATGVEVEKKGVVRAKRSIISAAGVEVTYRKLLDELCVQKAGGPPRSLLETEQKGSGHHIYCFVGMDGTSEELNLPTYNLWNFPCAAGAEPDVGKIWQEVASPDVPAFLKDDALAKSAQLPCIICFPSAKDPQYNSRCPGKSTAVLLTDSRASYFVNAGPTGKRGEEYAKFKSRYEAAFLNTLCQRFPHLRAKISYVDVATPLSNDHYLGRVGSYGLDHSISRLLDTGLRIDVPGIRGLYLTGQDMYACGIFTQPMVAWMTFGKVMGFAHPRFWILLLRASFAVAWRMLFRPKMKSTQLEQLLWLLP
mmetsp:Transcript_42205/g.99039  ORF Transcript_42205/g.99039 Transcript_42205/m.99039 type:complete len:588 (+) Transcript_42205:114-1877(+)